MATTTNFGWETPDDTDLVKDGAAAIRTLGSAIDTSLVDLKGGTTGQVLSKTSNTDMDFTWVTSDDANAIQNAIVDAKGDLIAASAADTPARLAVGNNGETLVADSSTSTGLRWQGDYAAGKNKLLNADFAINQRAFTSVTTSGGYGFDRWSTAFVDGTNTMTPQTFTAGTAPVAGYEAANFVRIVSSGQVSTSSLTSLAQRIEDVRTFAGQTITVSFWAKASTGTPNIVVYAQQNFGAGGSSSVNIAPTTSKQSITASWARYSFVISIPSISGKTLGTGSYLSILLTQSAGSTRASYTDSIGIQSVTIDYWGVQAEIGNVATSFNTATGNLVNELAGCQRYYWNQSVASASNYIGGFGPAISTTQARVFFFAPVPMRIQPSSTSFGSLQLSDGVTATAATGVTLSTDANNNSFYILVDVASGLTQYRNYTLLSSTGGGSNIAFNAEL